MLHFHNIFKYKIFQKGQKALLWSKGLINQQQTKMLRVPKYVDITFYF